MLRQQGIALLCLLCLVSAPSAAKQVIREQKTVTVEGVKETWQLVWEDEPSLSECSIEDISSAITCPCSGFAYGESGSLSLVRKRGSQEIERLDLGKLFDGFSSSAGKKGMAILVRWPQRIGDSEEDPRLLNKIKQRPLAKIIDFQDYNHDGAATEFLLQIGTQPCMKHMFVGIGITKKRPTLHVLNAAGDAPDESLVMTMAAWKALRKSHKPTTVTILPCGDHGSDVRIDYTVSAKGGEIFFDSRVVPCPEWK